MSLPIAVSVSVTAVGICCSIFLCNTGFVVLRLPVSGCIEAFGPLWHCVWLNLGVSGFIEKFVGSTWAFPGSSRRSSLRDIPDSSILAFRGSSRRRARRGVAVTKVWVFLGPSRRWVPRGVIVGSIWALQGSSRRYSLRGIAKADQKKGRKFTLGILCALWTHLACRHYFRVSLFILAFNIHSP